MGIRISKVLGWGIELTLEEYDTMLQIPSEEDGVTFAGYFDYLDTIDYSDSMSEGLEKVLIRGSEIYVSQMTVFSVVHEFHENNSVTVVIVPVTEAHIWARYDDSIDYYDSRGDTKNSVQYLEDGIYPYSNVYMNKHTGKMLTGEEIGKYRVYKILKKSLRGTKNPVKCCVRLVTTMTSTLLTWKQWFRTFPIQ